MSEHLSGVITNEGAVTIQDEADFESASMWRRLFAMLYDSFLVIAVLITGTALALTVVGHDIPPGTMWFEGYLLALWAIFFTWFWTHGGQTTGMAAWKIRAVQKDLQPLTWKGAFSRFFWASVCLLPFGVGLLWTLVDKEGRTLYDCLSGTRLVRVWPTR